MSQPPPVGADLLALVERLWAPDSASSPVAVGFGSLPEGHTVVEEYVVVPSLRRPSFLVPVAAPVASRSAFTRNLTTSSTRTRALGYLSALAFGSGVGDRLVRSRLYVGIDHRIESSQWSQWLLLRHLQEELAADDLLAYLPVRRPGPNSKPTMQLFERSGRPRGYVKVGWSAATRAVVQNEAAALRDIDGRLRLLQAPRLAAAGVWADREYAVAEPLPAGVRPWRREPSTTPDLLLDIARSGTVSRGPLAGSGFAQRVRSELQASVPQQPEAARVLLDWLLRLEQRTDVLAFGRWHGDFVPWNLGLTAAGPVAWDWEFSAPEVPVGFDLVHWHFQHRLSPADAALNAAVAVADGESWRLSALDVPTASVGLVTSLYLLEMFTRNVRMAAAGAGWNPKYHPALLDVAGLRDR